METFAIVGKGVIVMHQLQNERGIFRYYCAFKKIALLKNPVRLI